MKTIREAEVFARRCRLMMMDRNTISSVIGPCWQGQYECIVSSQVREWQQGRPTAMKLRKPIQLRRVSESPRPRIQSLQPPSAIPLSNSGPVKRMAVSRTSRKMSRGLNGHQPRIFKDSAIDRLPFCVMRVKTANVVIIHVKDTIRTRVRITEGASLLSVGDGRVVEER